MRWLIREWPYATLLAATLVLRRYNPGLWAALALLLPLGAWALPGVSGAARAGWQAHALAPGTAVLVHALIIVYVKLRLRRLPA